MGKVFISAPAAGTFQGGSQQFGSWLTMGVRSLPVALPRSSSSGWPLWF
jgi:hypothetical protein